MAVPEPPRPPRRVAIITGATSGIGLETAYGIASRGFHTVLVGRGVQRTESAAASVRQRSSNPVVDGIAVDDLSTQREWVRLGGLLKSRYPAIHVLVNNAGALFAHREVNEDGVERTWALNVLTPLALSTLLADRLITSAPSRIVNVASAAHRGAHVDFSDLERARSYRGCLAYARSKLELILLTRELARRLRGSGVTVNALHPGFVRSGFGHNTPGALSGAIGFAARLGAISPARGAETSIRLACDDDLAEVSGVYFSRGRQAPGSVASRDLEAAARLYEACLAYLPVPTVLTLTSRVPPALRPASPGAGSSP